MRGWLNGRDRVLGAKELFGRILRILSIGVQRGLYTEILDLFHYSLGKNIWQELFPATTLNLLEDAVEYDYLGQLMKQLAQAKQQSAEQYENSVIRLIFHHDEDRQNEIMEKEEQ